MQSRYAGTSDLTGLFMVNMTYKKAQTELCRSYGEDFEDHSSGAQGDHLEETQRMAWKGAVLTETRRTSQPTTFQKILLARLHAFTARRKKFAGEHAAGREAQTASVNILPLGPNDNHFRDYGKNSLKFTWKLKTTLGSYGYGWQRTYIKKIAGCRSSIIGLDLMSQLVLQLIQAAAGYVLNIQGSLEQQQDKTLEEWHLHFCEQYKSFINRVGQIGNY